MLNQSIISFAFLTLSKNKSKNISTFFIFFAIVFLISSVLFLSNSIEKEITKSIKNEPQLKITNHQYGNFAPIDDFLQNKISNIKGINSIIGQIQGDYYFEPTKSYLKIFGIDFFTPNANQKVNEFLQQNISKSNQNIVFASEQMRKKLAAIGYKNEITIFLYDGESLQLKLETFDAKHLGLNFSDVLLVQNDTARELLGLESFQWSYFFADIPNEIETNNIALQIRVDFPFAILNSTDQRISQISKEMNQKSSIFLSMFLVAILSFVILLYQKTMFSFQHEKKEIGILRAIGWKINDVIAFKMIQNIFIAIFAFFSALVCAYLYIFLFDAPLIAQIFFIQNSELFIQNLSPNIDISQIAILFFVTVLPFMASVLLPVWRLSITEPTEVMK